MKNQLTNNIHEIVISFFVLFMSRKNIEKEADDMVQWLKALATTLAVYLFPKAMSDSTQLPVIFTPWHLKHSSELCELIYTHTQTHAKAHTYVYMYIYIYT